MRLTWGGHTVGGYREGDSIGPKELWSRRVGCLGRASGVDRLSTLNLKLED